MRTPIIIQEPSPSLLNRQFYPTHLKVSAHISPDSRIVKQTLDTANSANGNVLVPDLPVGKVHNILGRNVVNDTLNLARAHSPPRVDNLPANILSNRRGTVQRQENRSLELSLGPLNLGLGDVNAETGPLAESKVNKVVDLSKLIRVKVDTPQTEMHVSTKPQLQYTKAGLPSITVASRKAHEAVGEVVLVHKGAQLAASMGCVAEGLVVIANDGLSHQSGEVVVVVPADALDGNGDVGSRDGVVTNSDVRANKVGSLLGQDICAGLGGLGGQAGEVLLGHLHQLFVRNAASANQYHAVSSVVVVDVVDKLCPRNVPDVLAGAEDGAAQRLVLVRGSVQVVEYNLLELLLNLLRLAQDHIAFPLNCRLFELRVLENVLKNIDTLGNVLVQGLGKVDGVLALYDMLVGG